LIRKLTTKIMLPTTQRGNEKMTESKEINWISLIIGLISLIVSMIFAIIGNTHNMTYYGILAIINMQFARF
jgi:hypothetical protein